MSVPAGRPVSDWLVERRSGPAAALHEHSADLVAGAAPAAGRHGPLEADGARRRILVLEATGPAVVLGRAEPEGHVDRGRAAAAGVEVVRRRSGGGAVLVGPGHMVWVDVVVPADDPLWSADVGRAMWWVGEAWVAALEDVGLRHATVWHGPQVRNGWSDQVCFAGLGHGEVTVVGEDGRAVKVVGMAQRRTRWGAVFQCSAPVRWQPEKLLDVLALSDARRRSGAGELAGVALGVGGRAEALVEAVIQRVRDADKAGRCGQLP